MRLGKALAIAIADFKSLWKERVVVFWCIAWPIIMLVLGAYIFTPPEVGSRATFVVGVANFDEGFKDITSATPLANTNTSLTGLVKERSVGQLLVSTLKNMSDFKVIEYNSTEKLFVDLEKARLDIGIVIPGNFSREIVFGTARLRVYVSGEDPREVQINRGFAQGFFYQFSKEVAVSKVKAIVKSFELFGGNYTEIFIPEINMTLKEVANRSLMGLANPVDVIIEEKVPQAIADRPFIIGWYTIGAIGMTMLYSGLTVGAIAVVIEKETGRLDRMISAGVRAYDLFLGKTLSATIMMLIASIIIVLAGLGVGARILWSPLNPRDWLVPLNLFLAFLMTMSIGFVLSLAVKSSRAASTLGTVLGLLLAFTTGIWVPKFMLPQPLRVFADAFPVTWAIDAVRAVMVYNEELPNIITTQINVIIATVSFIVLGMVAYRKIIARYVEIV
jgi:ABC-2 type transport system permease protein